MVKVHKAQFHCILLSDMCPGLLIQKSYNFEKVPEISAISSVRGKAVELKS